MTFNPHVAKVDLHNVAYNADTQELKLGPTSQVKVGSEFLLSVSLHKWVNSEGPNKGSYIAALVLGDTDTQGQKQRLQSTQLMFEEQGPRLFSDIETGALPEHVRVYKFSVNVWRSVSMKKIKWAYDDTKPSKDDPSSVQRLLVT